MAFDDIISMIIPKLSAPFITGILMTVLVDGKDGLVDLFSRMKKWNVGGRWYVPLLIVPILLLVVSLTLSLLVSAELAPAFFVIGAHVSTSQVAGLIRNYLEDEVEKRRVRRRRGETYSFSMEWRLFNSE